MKILHTVESYLPSRHGMQEVVTQLSEALVQMGHEVTIATSYDDRRSNDMLNGVKIVGFKISGNVVSGISGDIKSYQNFLKQGNFDLITNFAAQQWATDLMLPLLKELRSKKVFVPTGFSGLNNPSFKRYFENMKVWMKEYDSNIFLSNNYRDVNFAKINGIKSIEVIPNGASQKEFDNTEFVDIRKLLRLSPGTKLILTVGSHTGYKGHGEAIKIFNKAKIDNACLLIIGNVTSGNAVSNLLKSFINLFKIKRTNCDLSCKLGAAKYNIKNNDRSVIVKSFTRCLTVNAYRQSDLFLFPSLIECSPIVLFEAMAASTPFLVSDVGNSKEIIEWTKGGKLLPTEKDCKGYSIVNINQSAELLKNTLASKEELDNYSIQGHHNFMDKFTWEAIARRYNDLYLRIVNNI